MSVGDSYDGFSRFVETVNFLLGEDSPPQTMTTSYGFDEHWLNPALARWAESDFG